jgi:hypothetical protein
MTKLSTECNSERVKWMYNLRSQSSPIDGVGLEGAKGEQNITN